jgi:hypothetical protein
MLKLEPKRKQDEGGGTKRAGVRKSAVNCFGHNNQDGNDAIAHAATVLSMHFMDGHCPHVHVLKNSGLKLKKI